VRSLKCTLPLLDAKGAQKVELDENFLIDDEAEDREFDTKYSKLVQAQTPEIPPTAEVTQARNFFAFSLGNLCRNSPGKYLGVINQGLTPEEILFLQNVLQQGGVALV
jgi:hypothetical protein